MKDNEINIAIAEACGWKRGPITERLTAFYGTPATQAWYPPKGEPDLFTPNYCHDLNAMHEAEGWLLKESQSQPTDKIWSEYSIRLDGVGICIKFHATARQRAEAFLRTIGKWKA